MLLPEPDVKTVPMIAYVPAEKLRSARIDRTNRTIFRFVSSANRLLDFSI